MKKRSLKFIACAAVMAMTLSVTACGGSDDAAPAAGTEEAVEETAEPAADDAAEPAADDAAEAETEETAEPAADETAEPEAEPEEADAEAEAADESTDGDSAAAGETLESIFNDPDTKSQYESVFESMAQDGMSIAVETEGNELAVVIKVEDSSLIQDGMGEALEAALDQQASNFEAMAGQLDEAIGATGECTLIMRYLDPDGNVLAEKSYQAQ